VRLTKFPQSCVVVEHDDGGRLLIDPGSVAMDAHGFDDFGTVDAVLFTHVHADHFDPRAVAAILDRGLPIHANADVCAQIDGPAATVDAGGTFTAAGFDVVAHDMPHVAMVDGTAGPPNTGFVLDGRLLHPGDSLDVDGVTVDAVAVPIAGPSISFRGSYIAVERTGAATAVPIHYDVYLADPQMFRKVCDIASVVVLADGESVNL
jgi:L-ascorbate metabolism protein UlaG (beta-lactamase superfamily)